MSRWPIRPTPIVAGLVVLLGLGLAVDVIGHALAQTSPFGVPRSAAPPPPAAEGLTGWLLAKQAEFYRGLSATLRAAKADGSALVGLFSLSFLYGIFHAAGPGHGKAVISSYLVANEETWRRGVILSFASAMLQALVAVVLVGVAAAVFKATSKTMCDTERVIEVVSYGLIALVGVRLMWVKGRGFFGALMRPAPKPASLGAAASEPRHHGPAHRHDHHDHDHDHAHCGHAHGPEPQDLAGPGGWRRGLSAIVAVGLRPCSGAILVLVFALAQGLFWAGVGAVFLMGIGTFITVAAIATLAVGAKTFAARFASRRSGAGMLGLRGIEFAAAVVVFAFGMLLLMGYLAAERVTCF